LASQALHNVATVDPLSDEYTKELDAAPHFQFPLVVTHEGVVEIRMTETVNLKA
jgi:hypothetical protein